MGTAGESCEFESWVKLPAKLPAAARGATVGPGTASVDAGCVDAAIGAVARVACASASFGVDASGGGA